MRCPCETRLSICSTGTRRGSGGRRKVVLRHSSGVRWPLGTRRASIADMKDRRSLAFCLGAVFALAGCGNSTSGSAGSGGDGTGGTGGEIGALCDPECGAADYCAGDMCDTPGECEARPEMCLDVFDPVCGCDGETYGNACEAAAAGIRVDFEGRCPCFTNDDCESTEFCVPDDVSVCGPGPGQCQLKPTDCQDLFDPVCGCDGQTYDTDCFANAAGVKVSADAPCDCDINDDCDPGDYCNAQTCNGPGSCEIRPDLCAPESDTVVACTGIAYQNSCFAAQAGERVRLE